MVVVSLINRYAHKVVYNVFVLPTSQLNNNWLKESVKIILVCFLIIFPLPLQNIVG